MVEQRNRSAGAQPSRFASSGLRNITSPTQNASLRVRQRSSVKRVAPRKTQKRQDLKDFAASTPSISRKSQPSIDQSPYSPYSSMRVSKVGISAQKLSPTRRNTSYSSVYASKSLRQRPNPNLRSKSLHRQRAKSTSSTGTAHENVLSNVGSRYKIQTNRHSSENLQTTANQAAKKSPTSSESSSCTQYSYLSPPPPPPPPNRVDKRHTRKGRPTTQNEPKQVRLSINESEYVQRINMAASAQRVQKAKVKNNEDSLQLAQITMGKTSNNSSEIWKLEKKISMMQTELQEYKLHSQKLKDVNRRLQDRLVLFQKQNVENVQVAAKTIESLKNAVRAKDMQSPPKPVASLLHNIKNPGELRNSNIIAGRQLHTLRTCFNCFKMYHARQHFQRLSICRRSYEKKALILREWACFVMLQKVIYISSRRRMLKCAKKCFRGWEEYVWMKRAEKRSVALADEYRQKVFVYGRCFRAWKKYYQEAKLRSSRHTNIISLRFKTHTKSTLKHTFLAWKSLTQVNMKAEYVYNRMYKSYILSDCLSKWKTSCIRAKKELIKERELTILSLAQLSDNLSLTKY